jgi:spore coat protein U-like protein
MTGCGIASWSRAFRGGREAGKCVTLAALLTAPLCPASLAQAGTATTNMTVQIEITAACSIAAAPTLDFGSNTGLALTTAAVSGSTSVSVTCTNGSPYSIGFGLGSNALSSQRRLVYSGVYLPYNLYVDAAHQYPWSTGSTNATCTTSSDCYLGTGSGSAQTVNIYGSVPTVAVAPGAGTYSDTVLMTVTY